MHVFYAVTLTVLDTRRFGKKCRLQLQGFRTRPMRNVASKRREMNYSATDNNNTEDMNPQISHEGHVPTAIRGFFWFVF
jgi:hypothetical protein